MKKITGKALSLVLSIALVASGFSASFASAATKSETATASLATDDTVYLANDGDTTATQSFDVTDYVGAITLKTYDHQEIDDATIQQVTTSSPLLKVTKLTDANKATYGGDKDDYVVTIKSPSTTSGTFTVNILAQADWNRDDTDETVTGRASFTVVVLPSKTLILAPYATDYDSTNSPTTASFSAVKLDTTGNQQVDAALYYPTAAGSDAKASFKQLDAFDRQDDTSTPTYDATYTNSQYVVQASSYLSNSAALTGNGFIAPTTVPGANKDLLYTLPQGMSAGTNLRLTAYATTSADDGSKTADDATLGTKVATANFTVANTVKGDISDIAKGDNTITAVTLSSSHPDGNTNSVAGADSAAQSTGKTYAMIKTGTVAGTSVAGDYADVTGANVETTAGSDLKVESGKIGNLVLDAVTGVEIQSASVGSVTFKKAASTLDVSGGTVGAVDTTDDAGNATSVGIDSGSIASIDDTDAVNVEGGKVGNVTATDVEIAPTDSDTPAVVGNIAAETVTANSAYSAVTTGTITINANDDAPIITLTGDSTKVGAIDFAYYAANLKLNGFTGTVAAPAHATVDSATISSATDDTSSVSDDTKAQVTGNTNIDTLDLENGSVQFTGALQVGTLSGGDATLVINAGALNVTNDVASSNTLKLADPTTVVPGTKLYTAADGIADETSLTGYGFTQKVTTGTTTDAFYIDTVSFAGLSVTGPASLTVGTTGTYVASPFPAGQSLPAGETVAWDFSGDSGNFDFSSNGSTATVKALAVDSTFNTLNDATLTAYVVDEYGMEDTNYAETTYDITATALPAFVSDTPAAINLAQGSTYQYKFTSSDGSAPTSFGVGSSALTYTPSGISGNSFFYKVTATGAVGQQVGVYLNGQRVCIVTITAASVKTDTPAAITVAAGQSYQFKVTAGVTGTPVYTSGTPSAVSIASSKVVGSDHFFTVKAVGKAGQAAGIYVNGVRVCVVTVK